MRPGKEHFHCPRRMPVMIHIRSNRSDASGMSLLEVLVGVLLISFGLLGLLSLLSRTTQFSTGAEDSQRAALLAAEMVAFITTTNTATAADLVIDEDAVTAWKTSVASPQQGLPNGVGTITAAGRTARITVQWRAPSAAAGTFNNYITDVVLP